MNSFSHKVDLAFESLKKYIYDFIRRTFWKDYDPNEEFECGTCGKQMLNRYLFCSTKCSETSAEFMGAKIRNEYREY